MEDFYKQSDVIFQDCECIGVDTAEKKYVFGSGVHANYGQLAGYENSNSIKLDEETRGKMLLSHYQDFVYYGKDFFGHETDWDALAEEDGFGGFVSTGEVISA